MITLSIKVSCYICKLVIQPHNTFVWYHNPCLAAQKQKCAIQEQQLLHSSTQIKYVQTTLNLFCFLYGFFILTFLDMAQDAFYCTTLALKLSNLTLVYLLQWHINWAKILPRSMPLRLVSYFSFCWNQEKRLQFALKWEQEYINSEPGCWSSSQFCIQFLWQIINSCYSQLPAISCLCDILYFGLSGILFIIIRDLFFLFCVCYLQGSVAIAGACIRWLRDNLGIIKSSEESGLFLKLYTRAILSFYVHVCVFLSPIPQRKKVLAGGNFSMFTSLKSG